ncbi:BZ3500_MvSof-1268-A1-R1_Chr1-2g01309 [Microbotryum saponariae]|uniref:BZ3500_MvSof-1268-A1-R1_Chr1-2g01309 protein n=1 Tax=Microbotryum saponariae TaxID=289078 RepID=A0A2X0KSI7_9BASI|nr:BZ3500_MvSof-1268-A1-R1_Chr1-2g01309 [Microbotryum saponariae]SCZ97049.1 BZ3501_MvSof-1269-A2-R1_Chr1-2g00908 [Microbotryum saponariae]
MSTPAQSPMTPQQTITMLDRLFGPMIVGVFLQTFVIGILCVQASHYFARSTPDPLLCRQVVIGLALCAKSVLDIENVYRDATLIMLAFIQHIFAVGDPPSSIIAHLLLSRTILAEVPHFAAQCFLTFQIWVITENMIIPTLVGAAGSLLSLALFIVFASKRVLDPKAVATATSVTEWIPPWVVSCAAVDVYLSLILAYFVLKAKKLKPTSRFDMNVIRQIASTAVTICFPGAIMAVLMAILEISDTKVAIWMLFAVPLASVYSMCVLYALNSRDDLTEGSTAHAWSGQENGTGIHGHGGIGSDPANSKAHPVSTIFTRSNEPRNQQSGSSNGHAGHATGGDLELAELEKGDHHGVAALEEDQDPDQGGFMPKSMIKKHRKGMRSGVEFEVQVTRTIEKYDTFGDSNVERIEHEFEKEQ